MNVSILKMCGKLKKGITQLEPVVWELKHCMKNKGGCGKEDKVKALDGFLKEEKKDLVTKKL